MRKRIGTPGESGGRIPLIDVAGTARECGRMLGWTWQHALREAAEQRPSGLGAWWSDRRIAHLVERGGIGGIEAGMGGII